MQANFQKIEPSFSLDFIFSSYFYIIFVLALFGLIALIEILTKDFKDKQDRLFWLIAVLLTWGFASFFYIWQRDKLLKD